MLVKEIKTSNRLIKAYSLAPDNIDEKTVNSFGEEWKAFHGFSAEEIKWLGDQYFDIVPDEILNNTMKVIDIGCGSGRYIKYLKGRYAAITGIDPSEAIFTADRLIGKDLQVELIQASTDNIPFEDGYFDFGYSLGVLHHIPDTARALQDSVRKIKPGGHFLLYLYYNLDNKPFYFRVFFFLSNLLRLIVSKLPGKLKRICCDVLAVLLYMPLVLL